MFLLSIISCALSVSLSVSVYFLRYKAMALKMPCISHLLKFSVIKFLLVLSLYFYRYLCKVSKKIFYGYVVANATIIVLFYFIRLYVISNQFILVYTTSFYVSFFILFLISLAFAISRLFFRIGFLVNNEVMEMYKLMFVSDPLAKNTANIFIHLGWRICDNLPQNPGVNGVDRHFLLGFGTFLATSVAASGGVYLCYEAYQTRQIKLQTLGLSKESVILAERAEDRAAVSAGLMSDNVYHKKWDEFERQRKS